MVTAKSAGLTFQNSKNIERPWVQMFLMGEPGTGKTALAATFPRPLFLVPVNEDSMTTLKGQDFDYIEITSMHGAVENGRGGMLTAVQGLHDMYVKDPDKFPFDTIVVEQLGHYSDIIQNELTGGTNQMDQQKWGKHLRHLTEVQGKLRRMDAHLIWTSHTKIEKISDTSSINGANISGQAATKIPSSCDIIGYCEIGAGNVPKHRTHFRKFNGFSARSRIPLPAMIENCTYDLMAPYLFGGEQ